MGNIQRTRDFVTSRVIVASAVLATIGYGALTLFGIKQHETASLKRITETTWRHLRVANVNIVGLDPNSIDRLAKGWSERRRATEGRGDHRSYWLIFSWRDLPTTLPFNEPLKHWAKIRFSNGTANYAVEYMELRRSPLGDVLDCSNTVVGIKADPLTGDPLDGTYYVLDHAVFDISGNKVGSQLGDGDHS